MLSLPNPYNDELCGSEQLFNSNSEPCEPCTPETLQVRWADIIDKPLCFPTCSPEVTGVTSLNGLAGNVTLGIGSTGTNFNIVSSSGTITLNLPIADATKTGKLSSIDWNIFNNKQNPITLITTGDSGAATFIGNILNIPNYTLAGLGGVSGTGTINYLAKWTFTTTTALTNSIVYDNGTQVGIGTFAPTALLDVVTASTITSSIKARNSNGATILSNTSAIGSLSTDWNAPLAFSTNSVEHMRILTNGNVGIGTNNPGSLLDVKGSFQLSGATSGFVGFTAPNIAGSTTYTLPSADGTTGQFLSTNGSGALSWATVTSQWITNGSSIYYNIGNVGIGISSPTELLHVDGGSTLKNILLKTTATGIASSGYLYENGNGTIKLGGFNSTLGVGTTGSYGFNLFYNSTAVLTVDAGKIGINNSFPTSTLHIKPPVSGFNPTVTIEELFNNRSYNIYVTDITGDLYIERAGAVNGARLRLGWDSNFTFGSGLITGGVTHYTSSGILDPADYIVWVGHPTNSITLTLPALSTVQHGKTYIIKRISQHSVTVNKNAADPNFDFPHNGLSNITLADKQMVKVVAWKDQPPRGTAYPTSFWIILSN